MKSAGTKQDDDNDADIASAKTVSRLAVNVCGQRSNRKGQTESEIRAMKDDEDNDSQDGDDDSNDADTAFVEVSSTLAVDVDYRHQNGQDRSQSRVNRAVIMMTTNTAMLMTMMSPTSHVLKPPSGWLFMKTEKQQGQRRRRQHQQL